MHAIRQYEFGSAEELRYEEVPDLHPGDGQVRIAVEAAGVHLVDTTIRQGLAGGAFASVELPMTPGREVAGIVDHVGPDVDESWLGRRVVAHLGMASGGYAEQALAAVGSLHVLPDDARCRCCRGDDRHRPHRDRACSRSPRSTPTTSSSSRPPRAGSACCSSRRPATPARRSSAWPAARPRSSRCAALGADIAVDYTEDGWADQVREQLGERAATVVLDGVGGKVGAAVFDLLGVGGRMILFGYSSGEPTILSTTDIIGRSLTVTAAIGPRLINRPGACARSRPRPSPRLRRAGSSRSSAAASASPTPPSPTPPSRPARRRARSC